MATDDCSKAQTETSVSLPRRDHLRSSMALLAAGAISQLPWVVAPIASANEQPAGMQPVDLEYAGYLISGVGATPLASARLRAFEQQGRYEIKLSVESFLADLTYLSTGRIGPNGLIPMQYTEQRKVAFRSERQKLVNYIHSEDPALQNTMDGDKLYVPPGSQDRLSLILQIIWMSRRDPKVLSDNRELELPFARVNRVSASRWLVRGPERLSRQQESGETGGRSRQMGYRISRVADSRETIDVSMWLSTHRGHHPLVLQFAEKGRSLRFVHDSV